MNSPCNPLGSRQRKDPPTNRNAGAIHFDLMSNRSPSLTFRAAALAGLLLSLLHSAPAAAFDFDDVAKRASEQARAPYKSSERPPPAELKALTYDQYRDIRFRPDHALWRPAGLPFELMFFHLGKFQTQPVLINEVTDSGVRHVPYDSADFNYGKNKLS